MPFFYLAIAFTLNATANVLLKMGAKGNIAIAGVGVFLFAINVVFYFLALKSIPITTAYPVMTIMSFLLINLFAYFYLSESINLWQILGYFLIVSGLIFVCYFAKPA